MNISVGERQIKGKPDERSLLVQTSNPLQAIVVQGCYFYVMVVEKGENRGVTVVGQWS